MSARPRRADRAAREVRFLTFYRRAIAGAERLRRRARLTDCTSSPENFDEGRRLLGAIGRIALEELREAGALHADGAGARQLDLFKSVSDEDVS